MKVHDEILKRDHEDLKNTLRRLAEKVKRANETQHSGCSITPEDWGELYQLTNEAFEVLENVDEK